ncbi:MAG: nucleotide exchange factor GrpE [Puniceicoccales bacterium]|jgi:molecular chaperone GrpE|nr:nucleotide exchange factor GrpE [Puniceicoccales bacterium]
MEGEESENQGPGPKGASETDTAFWGEGGEAVAPTAEELGGVAEGMESERTAVAPEERKYLAAYVQLQADFENFKKRAAREREEWLKLSNRRLIEELLTIVDHLDLALQSAKPEDEKGRQITQGFGMIVGQFKKLLAEQGLAEVGQVGEPFNPRDHEAVGQSAHPTVPIDHICQIVRRGYRLHDFTLRPASVIVSNGPENIASHGPKEENKSQEEVPS